MESMKKVVVLEGLDVAFGHIDVVCLKCGRKWGARPNANGEIEVSKTRCFECDSKKLAEIENK